MNEKMDGILNIAEHVLAAQATVAKLRDELNALVSELSMEDLESLSYLELKELKDKIQYTLEFHKFEKEFLSIMKEKKKELYPEMKGPYHYPALKEINADNEILVALDEILYHYRVGNYIYAESSFVNFYRSKLSFDDYVDKLVELGILAKHIVFYCNDSCECETIIDEETLNKHIRYWNLIKFIREGKSADGSVLDITKEAAYAEIDTMDDDWIGYIEIGCGNNGYYEITNYDEYVDACKHFIYCLKLPADTTYDNL